MRALEKSGFHETEWEPKPSVSYFAPEIIEVYWDNPWQHKSRGGKKQAI